MRLGVGHHANIAIPGFERPPVTIESPWIAHVRQRRFKHFAIQVLNQIKRGNRLKHRHLYRLSLTGSLSVEQRCCDRGRQDKPYNFVNDRHRGISRFAIQAFIQHAKARGGLNNIIVSRAVGIGTCLTKPVCTGVNNIRVNTRNTVISKAEFFHRLCPYAVYKNVGSFNQPLQCFFASFRL